MGFAPIDGAIHTIESVGDGMLNGNPIPPGAKLLKMANQTKTADARFAGKVTVTFEIDDDDGGDPEHDTGLTNDAYEKVFDALNRAGAYDIEIERGD
jgi:hypothetical protein